MDDDGGLGIRNWGYYEQPLKNNLGLQLMSSLAVDQDTKNILHNGAFLHRGCGIAEPPVPMDYVRDGWMHPRDKILQAVPLTHHPNYGVLSDASLARTIQIPQTTDPSKDDRSIQTDELNGGKDTTLKKRSQGRPTKGPKPKKPKRIPAPSDETANGSAPRGRSVRKNTEMVINGLDMDFSEIPTPICSCTGTPQPCYRWGMGGWQSACCTTSISMYPLPMSTKRRGARIAGRKMSQGAFKKVLEKLASERYNFHKAIDLKTYWAKHGTNKFVTIR